MRNMTVNTFLWVPNKERDDPLKQCAVVSKGWKDIVQLNLVPLFSSRNPKTRGEGGLL